MKRLKLLAILITFLVSTASFAPRSAIAEEGQAEIAISPVSNKIEIAQGETYTGKVYVANVGDIEFDYQVEIKPFGVSDSTYRNINYEDNEYTNITGWTTLSKTSGHLEPNSNEAIEYTVTVPEKAFAGGQYFVVAASTTQELEQGQTGFNITGSVASIIYTTIAGDAKNSGEIIDNAIPSSFLLNGPVEFKSTVKNTGDVHNTATYFFEVTNAFNGETIYSNREEPLTHLILPKTERTETSSWDTPMFGVFRAKQTIEYAGETSIKEQTIVVCPLWAIIAVIAIIAIIIVRIIMFSRKRRSKHLI